MVAVDETAERKLSAKVSRPILSCKHGSWDTWNVLMKNYINVHDGWNEIVFENRLKDVAKKRLPSKPRKPSGSGQPAQPANSRWWVLDNPADPDAVPSLYTGKELLAAVGKKALPFDGIFVAKLDDPSGQLDEFTAAEYVDIQEAIAALLALGVHALGQTPPTPTDVTEMSDDDALRLLLAVLALVALLALPLCAPTRANR